MPSVSLFGLGGLVALGLSLGALATLLQERPVPAVQTYGASAIAPAESQPAPTAASNLEVPQPQPLATVKAAAKTPVKIHPRLAAKAARAQPTVAISPQKAWEEQRQAYERAVAAYDANEASEGYRWAQQNHIRLEQYCRVAERRTPAFMQGCLSYLRREPAPTSAAG
jgi:hypothetical protein